MVKIQGRSLLKHGQDIGRDKRQSLDKGNRRNRKELRSQERKTGIDTRKFLWRDWNLWGFMLKNLHLFFIYFPWRNKSVEENEKILEQPLRGRKQNRSRYITLWQLISKRPRLDIINSRGTNLLGSSVIFVSLIQKPALRAKLDGLSYSRLEMCKNIQRTRCEENR